MENPILISFVTFLAVNLALGLYQGRNVRTASTFILGRRLTTSALLLTLTGTLIGGEYLTGWLRVGSPWGGGNLFLWVLATVSTGLIATFYIFPQLRKFRGWYTLGDIARQAYGSVYAQVAVDGIGLVSSVILLSAQLVGLKRMTGLLGYADNHLMAYVLVVVFTLVVIAYASRSGTPGVVSTDVLQMVLVLGGTGFMVYKILDLNLGDIRIQGLADLWHQVKATAGKNPLRYFLQEEPTLQAVILTSLGSGLILFSPAFIKRVAMASDERQLKHSMLGFLAVWSFFMLMILVSAFGLYVVRGSYVAHEYVYPTLLQIIPHTWMRIVLLIMFLAAVMSTSDSVLTAASIVGVRIISSLRDRDQAIAEPTIHALRIANVIIGLLALGLALLFMQQPVVDFVVFARALLGSLVPCFVGISIGIRKSSKALLGGMACFALCFLASLLANKVVDLSFLDPIWNQPNYRFRWRYGLLLPFTTLFACLAYLLFEAMMHGGLKWEKRARFTAYQAGPLQQAWQEIKSFFTNPLTWAERKLDNYESRPVLLALFCILSFLSSQFIGDPLPEAYIKHITTLMLSTFTIATLLLTHDQWYKLPKHYYALLWHIGVLFCIPFSFLLRYSYHPNLLNTFYLLIVPFSMHAFVGRNMAVILSFVGYVAGTAVYRFTFEPGVILQTHQSIIMIGLCATTLWAWLAGGHHMQRSLEKAKRPKIWAGAWGHDLNHLFMEAQMETNTKYNPLPKEEKEGFKEAKQRLDNMAKYLQAGVSQSQAFRQLIIQDSIRPSEMVSMSLTELMRHVYDTLPGDLQEIVTIRGEVPMNVRVFVPMFTNILTNLLRNAWKVGAEKVDLDWYEKEPVLYIKDNGPGIPEEKLSTLFEMKPNRDGTGIGLPFIKEALHKMGALIDVTTTPKGTTFMIGFDQG